MLFKISQGPSSRISTEITPLHEGYAYFVPDTAGFYIDAKVNDELQRIQINPDQVFQAVRDETTYAEIVAAHNRGCEVLCIDGTAVCQLYSINEATKTALFISIYKVDDNSVAQIRAWNVTEADDGTTTWTRHSKVTTESVVNSVVELNHSAEQKFWRGTKEEFDAIETKDDSVMYIVTDDDTVVESDVFIVNLTTNLEAEGQNFSIDCTAEDIKAAIESKKIIVGFCDGVRLSTCDCNVSDTGFIVAFTQNLNYVKSAYQVVYQINYDNGVLACVVEESPLVMPCQLLVATCPLGVVGPTNYRCGYNTQDGFVPYGTTNIELSSSNLGIIVLQDTATPSTCQYAIRTRYNDTTRTDTDSIKYSEMSSPFMDFFGTDSDGKQIHYVLDDDGYIAYETIDNGGIFTVTIERGSNQASHTSEEILDAHKSGKMVILTDRDESYRCYTMYFTSYNGYGAEQAKFASYAYAYFIGWADGGEPAMRYVVINQDGRYIVVDMPIPWPSDQAPLKAGVAAAGNSEEYSRADHVHPQEVSDEDRVRWNSALMTECSGADIAAMFN